MKVGWKLRKFKIRSINKKLIVPAIMLFLSFMALSTATYAWIVASLNASLNAASMTTRIYGNFSIAQGKYETIEELTPGAFKKNVAFANHPEYSEKEISSNGQVFYTWGNTTKDPVTNKPLGFTALDTSVATLDANQEKDFIAQDFTFLASENTSIYLTNDSSITNEGPLASNIAPAARVAFYEWDAVNDEYDFKYMWAPNTAQITNGNKSGNIKYIADTNGTETTTNGLAYTNAGLPTVGGGIYEDEVYVANDIDGVENYAPPVTTITATEPTLKTIQVRIWLEGTDAAAINANLEDNKGQWKVDLRFSSGIKILPPPYSELIDGVKIQPNYKHLGLIPVTYDTDGNTKVADIYNSITPWFSYTNQKWANAVSISNANKSTYINEDGSYKSGNIINQAHIMAYFVYVPRYSYTVRCTSSAKTTCYGNTGSAAATSPALPGAIDIKFVDSSYPRDLIQSLYGKYYGTTSSGYIAQNGFEFGTENLAGIWVGKFTSTGSSSNPTILPNEVPLTNENIANKFKTSLKFGGGNYNTTSGEITWPLVSSVYGTTNANSHMMKNSEWLAVAYLSQSIYGKYGNSNFTGGEKEVFRNPSFNKITGRSGSASNSATVSDNSGQAQSALYGWTGHNCGTKTLYKCIGTKQNQYGMAASTTGNIYGVYDMGGGGLEAVMSNYKKIASASGNWDDDGYNVPYSFESGFSGKNNISCNYSSTSCLTGTNASGYAFPDYRYFDQYLYYPYINNEYTSTKLDYWYGDFIYSYTEEHSATDAYPWIFKKGCNEQLVYCSASGDGIFSQYVSPWHVANTDYSNATYRAVIIPTS